VVKRVAVRLAPIDKEFPTKNSVRLLADKVLQPINEKRPQPEIAMPLVQFIERFYLPAAAKTLRASTVSDFRDIWNRHHDVRHCTTTKLLEQGTPFAVIAQILGWSASTAMRMAKRYGHIRPEAQRQALTGIATQEIEVGVNQFVHQPVRALEYRLPN
jgi:hypothetical protein